MTDNTSGAVAADKSGVTSGQVEPSVSERIAACAEKLGLHAETSGHDLLDKLEECVAKYEGATNDADKAHWYANALIYLANLGGH